jgi:hypothetical protein
MTSSFSSPISDQTLPPLWFRLSFSQQDLDQHVIAFLGLRPAGKVGAVIGSVGRDVHGAGVYWPIGVFKFAGGRLYCGGGPRGTIQGGIGAFSVMSVRIPYGSVRP